MKNYSNRSEAKTLWEQTKKLVDTLPEPSIDQIINAKVSTGSMDENKHQLTKCTINLNEEEIKAEGSLINSVDIVYSYERCDKCKTTHNKQIVAYFTPALGKQMGFSNCGLSYTKSFTK